MWKWIKKWKGITKGNIEEKEGFFINQIDDSQIMLTKETVQKIYPQFKSAFDNEKPFRFNLRGNLKSTLKRCITGEKKQLQIRTFANHVAINYNPGLIQSSKTNYFETYYDWECIPDEFKIFITKEVDKE